MIVPDHWAQASLRERHRGRQVTVHRFGWSTTSLADAQAMAQSRAAEAMRRILAGEALDRRERKTAYNGAFGVPIREEVLARHGEEVITRNAYGARCLNTPAALIADIDFMPAGRARTAVATGVVLTALGALAGIALQSRGLAIGALILALLLAVPVSAALQRLLTAARGGPERAARRRIDRFLAMHPAWGLRLYRTPAGLRAIATHRRFDPADPEVAGFFSAIGADPLYVRMCMHQRCFRARLSAKPWRIGIAGHLRPRPGVWPVRPEQLDQRHQWVAAYEPVAARFAACHHVATLGSGAVHADVQGVIALHDRESRALRHELPLA